MWTFGPSPLGGPQKIGIKCAFLLTQTVYENVSLTVGRINMEPSTMSSQLKTLCFCTLWSYQVNVQSILRMWQAVTECKEFVSGYEDKNYSGSLDFLELKL